MPDSFVRDLSPGATGEYPAALALLRASRRTLIGHIDTGVAPHPGIGYQGDDPPPNLLIDEGANLFDPERDLRPVSPLRRSPGLVSGLTEFPDHGVKTLSVILGTGSGSGSGLRGVAPGVGVVPFRVSNGPLFRGADGPFMGGRSATEPLGQAIAQSLRNPRIRVLSISMGNPGWLGLLDAIVRVAGGGPGMDSGTGQAIDRAYEAGVIVVCAAGQVIDRVIYPARYSRTIGVGGFDRGGQLFRHYPPLGYDRPDLVDVSAQAMRINRAGFHGEDDPRPSWADDPRGGEGEPSGTSYATPQVAAAAALWLEWHHDALERSFGTERWKIVESFRQALHRSAVEMHASLQDGRDVKIRILDIPELLAMPPEPVTTAPAPPASRQGFW